MAVAAAVLSGRAHGNFIASLQWHGIDIFSAN